MNFQLKKKLGIQVADSMLRAQSQATVTCPNIVDELEKFNFQFNVDKIKGIIFTLQKA